MDWRYNTIWFDQIAEENFVSVDFSKRPIVKELLNKEYVLAEKFKSKTNNFLDFPPSRSIKCILLGSSNIKSFEGVSLLGNVKRLEAHYCLKLENDSGLSEIGQTLEWLHVNQSKHFPIGKELLALRNLKVLRLNSCAPLDDLEFLHNFPSLLDFRFVDTKVLSGDLTPLFEHPSLCSVGFLNKRHYNFKDNEVDEYLSEKRPQLVEKVYKGEYVTYRYTNLIA